MKVNQKLLGEQRRFLLDVQEPFLVNDFISQVMTCLPEASLLKCASPDDLLSEYHRSDLFGDGQRVIVRSSLTEEDIAIVDRLLDIPSGDIVILVQYDKIPKTKAFTRIRAEYTVVKIETPDERACARWVGERLRDEHIEYTERVPAFLVQRRGADLFGLASEIQKLKLLNKKINVDLCARFVISSKEIQLFDFSENFFRRRVADTLRLFENLEEKSYPQLIHFMIGQIERLYKVTIYKEQGHKADDIAELLGVPKFIVRTKILPLITSYGKVKLLRLLDLILELEKKLRSSKFPARLIFESYLLRALKL